MIDGALCQRDGCSNPLGRRRYPNEPRRFCSSSCAGKSIARKPLPRVARVCQMPLCARQFEALPSKAFRRFCSRLCSDLASRRPPSTHGPRRLHCNVCTAEFVVDESNRRCCSEACSVKLSQILLTGGVVMTPGRQKTLDTLVRHQARGISLPALALEIMGSSGYHDCRAVRSRLMRMRTLIESQGWRLEVQHFWTRQPSPDSHVRLVAAS